MLNSPPGTQIMPGGPTEAVAARPRLHATKLNVTANDDAASTKRKIDFGRPRSTRHP
jgi:hypothetical protein